MRDLFEEKLEKELPTIRKYLFNPKWTIVPEGRDEFKHDQIFRYDTLFWRQRIRFVIYPINNDNNLVNVFGVKIHKFYASLVIFLTYLENKTKFRLFFPTMTFFQKIGLMKHLIKEHNDFLTIDEVYLIYDYRIILKDTSNI